ncbi:hypothetical protein [Amycolatopsis arida]|uniref:hypothetical protein n=1 Tax=Amycolatopsis arida TaxID=587909 RepID=UPI001416F719|nr:hypothetical protein [Amycolatopsis arida]
MSASAPLTQGNESGWMRDRRPCRHHGDAGELASTPFDAMQHSSPTSASEEGA